MIRNLIGIMCCCMCVVFASAQELKPTVYYMNSAEVSQIAKDIHSGAVAAKDDDLVYTIADSMNTENDDTRPFYIFLVSKMLLNSKNQKLKLVLGEYCKRYLQNKPDPVIELLFSKTVKPEYKFQWAKAISADLDANCETTLKQCFKICRALSLEMCKTENKDKLEIIFNQIRTELELNNHQ